MKIIIPIIFYLYFNATIVFITKKPFGKTLILSFILSVIPIYITGIIFNNLLIGLILDIIFSLSIFVLLIINRKNKNVINEFIKNYFSTGLYFFLFILFVITIWNLNRRFDVWDEFSHWGKMVKEMVRLNKFYIVEESNLLVHKDYPPFVQTYEYIWNMLSFGFKENITVTALRVFEFSFLVSIFDDVKNKISNKIFSILQIPFLMLTFFCTLIFLDNYGIINSIYIDYLMGILLGYNLFVIFKNRKEYSNFNIIYLSCLLIFLLLMKQMGLPLYLLSIFFYFMLFIFDKNKNKKIFFKSFIFLVVIPIVMYFSWNFYSSFFETESQFKLSDIKISEVVDVINHTTSSEYKYREEVFSLFKQSLRTFNLTTSDIKLDYVVLVIGILIIFALLKIMFKKEIELKTYIFGNITIILGAVGYALTLGILYLFSFSKGEGLGMASFNRYMSTFIISLATFIIFIFFYLLNKKNNKLSNIIIISTLVLIPITLFCFSNKKNFKEKFSPKIDSNNYLSIYQIHASAINNGTEKGSNVFLVDDDSSGESGYYINYYLDGRRLNVRCINYKEVMPTYLCNKKETFDTIKNEYDYLYIKEISKFKEDFEEYFEGSIEKGLYDVIKENGTIKFKKHLNS